MQTKELIEALRECAGRQPRVLFSEDPRTWETRIMQQAADALEATLWRDDVENAPKDGTTFLAYDVYPTIAWFEPDWGYFRDDDDNELIFTHWKPLELPQTE